MVDIKPRVSIGVPVYNSESYLACALDSMLAQTYGDFELIISDNASTDRTPEICRQYAARDPRVRYLREERNRGCAWNFNRVFEVSQGEYFKWTAYDDLCAPSFLARMVEVLDMDPDVVLATSVAALIDARGELIPGEGRVESGEWRVERQEAPQRIPRPSPLTTDPSSAKLTCTPDRGFVSPQPHRRYGDILLHEVWGHQFYGLIRTDVLRNTGLHRPYCMAEKVLLAELALQGRFHVVPELLMYIRWHAEQVSQIASVAEQTLEVDAEVSRRWKLPFRVASTLGYLGLIPRAGLSPAEQVCCLLTWARYVLQVTKWKRVLREAISGVSIAGNTAPG